MTRVCDGDSFMMVPVQNESSPPETAQLDNQDLVRQNKELKLQLAQAEAKKEEFEMQVEASLNFNDQIKNVEAEEKVTMHANNYANGNRKVFANECKSFGYFFHSKSNLFHLGRN